MIQRATPEDVSELNMLVNSAYRGDSSRMGWTTEADLLDGIRVDEKRLEEIIQKPGAMILKYTDEKNKIIGCVHLEKKSAKGRTRLGGNSKLYLGMLTVSPVEQGRGIGKKIMSAAEDVARKLNCSFIYMTVITDRSELIAWYERHGYTNTGEKKPFPAGDPRFGLPKKFLEFVVLEKKL